MYAAYGIVDGKPTRALPPSHSEVSKDHAPHTEGSALAGPLGQLAALNPQYTVGEGSLFYGLHKALAKEADSHIIDKMQAVWNDQMQQNTMADLHGTPTLDAEKVKDEARDLRKVEERRAKKEGRTSRSYAEQGAGVAEVMTLVELFVSHPDDSSWWKPIVRAYVNAHEAEVLKHIRERNRTRAHRH